MRASLSGRSIGVALLAGAVVSTALGVAPAFADSLPHCKKPYGSVLILEPDVDWWSDLHLGSPRPLIEAFVDESGCFTRRTPGADLADKADFSLMPDAFGPPDREVGPTRGPGTDGVGGGAVGGGAAGGGINSDGMNGAPSVEGKFVGPRDINQVNLTLADQRTGRRPLKTQATPRDASASTTPIFITGGFGAGGTNSYVSTPLGRRVAAAYLEAFRSLIKMLDRQAAKEDRSK